MRIARHRQDTEYRRKKAPLNQLFEGSPRLRALLRWVIRVGRRRGALKSTTLRQYHAKAERRLNALVVLPTAQPVGRALQATVKAWRTKFFVFFEDPDVPATNNACEREIRPSVVFRKVTGGFRSP